MRYIMVTHWKGHWDKLSESETHYTRRMIKFPLSEETVVENAPTIFIKLNEDTKEPEKAWAGQVYSFKIEKDKVRFKVKIKSELPISTLIDRYLSYKEGWYLEKTAIEEPVIIPPFLYILRTTTSWKEFEKYTFWLLKLIGIHEIYPFKKQKGLADGFFVFRNLAVIYDCTLEEDFEVTKKQQIENYSKQLENWKIEYEKLTLNINQYKKQVWIITKGLSRLIQRINDIVVKEVSVDDLIKIYEKRLKENLGGNKLEKALIDISS